MTVAAAAAEAAAAFAVPVAAETAPSWLLKRGEGADAYHPRLPSLCGSRVSKVHEYPQGLTVQRCASIYQHTRHKLLGEPILLFRQQQTQPIATTSSHIEARLTNKSIAQTQHCVCNNAPTQK